MEAKVELTYAEPDEISDRLAAAFIRMGLHPLDRVIFRLGNCNELLYGFIARAHRAERSTNGNCFNSPRQNTSILDHLRPLCRFGLDECRKLLGCLWFNFKA